MTRLGPVSVTIANPYSGQLTVDLPPYLFTNFDEANKKITVSVGDDSIKHQKAMWGKLAE